MTDSLNNKELVAVGHELAKALSNDTPIIDIAKILTRLAERLDCTTAALREKAKQCDALAVENGQILRLLTNISENHDEYVNQDGNVDWKVSTRTQLRLLRQAYLLDASASSNAAGKEDRFL